MSNSIRLRELGQRDFREPAPFLLALRTLERTSAYGEMSNEERGLRTHGLKKWRETRIAALFCYGMEKRLGHKVYLAPGEVGDADFVASWITGDEQQLAPVQLKEVVPFKEKGSKDIATILDSLKKYGDSQELTVVLHLNQRTKFDPADIQVPDLKISSLWILACTSEDGNEWGLWGNFRTQVEETRFLYPDTKVMRGQHSATLP
jgi:hypothetical protein